MKRHCSFHKQVPIQIGYEPLTVMFYATDNITQRSILELIFSLTFIHKKQWGTNFHKVPLIVFRRYVKSSLIYTVKKSGVYAP